MNFLENITFRRTRTNSEPNDKDILSQTLDCTTNSLPDMSEDEENERIIVLKSEIEDLKSQLISAHKEIELLSLENSKLKQNNIDLIKKNEIFKTIASPMKQKNQTPRKIDTITNKKNTQNKQSTNRSSSEFTGNPNDSKKSSDKQTQTERQHEYGNNLEEPVYNHKHIKRNDKKRKICIVSNLDVNLTTLDILTNIGYGLHFDYCHYLLRHSRLQQLLSNIHSKVRNFSINDYCIIMIGEQDFKTNIEAMEMVRIIRDTLTPLTHTNFIICCPTYIHGALIYNYKVELFNNLLCCDIENHEYAYFVDSNRDLSCETFSYKTGKINKLGLQSIYKNIFQRLLVDIQNYPILDEHGDAKVLAVNTQENFFRSILQNTKK